MAWIGIECSVDASVLVKWSEYVARAGGTEVADLLKRCARQVSGAGSSVNGPDRLRELEARACEAAERKCADTALKVRKVIGGMIGRGVDADDMMSALGLDGWAGGSAAGGKNGGEANKRRARGRAGSRAAGGGVLAEPGRPALTGAETVARDSRYGMSWEGWAGAELQKRGFKMRHVARGVGMQLEECWRYVSGWTRHWRREGLHGRQFPGPLPGWAERLEQAEAAAKGIGLRGAEVKRNGTGDTGLGVEGQI